MTDHIKPYSTNIFIDFSIYNFKNLTQHDSDLKMRIIGLIGLIPTLLALPLAGALFLHSVILSCSFNPELDDLAKRVSALGLPEATKVEDNTVEKSTFKLDKVAYTIGKKRGKGSSKVVRTLTDSPGLVYAKLTKAHRHIIGFVNLLREIEFLNLLKDEDEFVNIDFIYRDPKSEEIIGMGLEDCDQGDFSHFFKNNKKQFESVKWDFFSFLASAVVKLKNHGIIHHDIKPQNLFIKEAEGKLSFKVGDFGLSQKIREENLSKSSLGTAYYMAPECFKTKVSRDKSDLWSVGIILYFIHFKTLPPYYPENSSSFDLFCFYKKNPFKFIQLKLNEDPNLQNAKTGSFEALIKDLLQVNPEYRISAEEFQSRLQKLIPA